MAKAALFGILGLIVGATGGFLVSSKVVKVIQVPSANDNTPAAVDPYEGWNTISPGGVVTMKIPPNCKGDPGAGSIYVTCPTTDNDSPNPDMVTSSDGITVNVRRWENQAWPEWDKVIASMRVISPTDRDITINVQH